MSLLDDIKRDSEAGTPGRWVGGDCPDGEICMDDDVGAWICCVNFEGVEPVGQARADARRIARVPQLEALVLAAEVLEKVLIGWRATGCPICAGDCASANPPISACMMKATSDALTAYRKATKDREMTVFEADGEKLRQMTGEDHGPYFIDAAGCIECGAPLSSPSDAVCGSCLHTAAEAARASKEAAK